MQRNYFERFACNKISLLTCVLSLLDSSLAYQRDNLSLHSVSFLGSVGLWLTWSTVRFYSPVITAINGIYKYTIAFNYGQLCSIEC